MVIKSRFVVLKKAGARSVSTHLRYIERDGTTRDGQKGQAYGPDTDTADLQAFEKLVADIPEVRECHMLNGEIDFILKCVAPDLPSFQSFLTEHLTSAPNVASVKTSLVIRCAKDEPGVPFELVEGR